MIDVGAQTTAALRRTDGGGRGRSAAGEPNATSEMRLSPQSRRFKMGTITALTSWKAVGIRVSSVESIMRCPPALLAATFLLQVVIFCWKVICLIEDTIPNWENLASLRKTRATFFEGGAWRNWRLPIGVAHRAH